ncbi:glutamate N-acetyltransferase [Dimargaris verticillata]|uniref:Arginine biosynthesis bifunctional protein ArgJ, mitochondrial n=1 Tax=Dimargaris verticillata TaxID=2761393 RepID=A0A9W8B309_9FUNG|nr:glutamate N-acetyltransferase [Dimargaris verticillata]
MLLAHHLTNPRPFWRSFATKARYVPTSGTYPQGFVVGGVHCGVKKKPDQPDLALIGSQVPCRAAAVFTQNKFTAAPVQISRFVLDHSRGMNIQGIVTNSGCANAVTGTVGLEHARRMSQVASQALTTVSGGSSQPTDNAQNGMQALVMSTGVIGQRLPIDTVERGIRDCAGQLGNTHEHWLRFSQAYMTTDTFPKLQSSEYQLPSGLRYRMAGVSKGAGMIHPNMATLLGTVATDLAVTSECLRDALKFAVDRSFNAITVDGDTSTNDTIAILANGQCNASPTAAPLATGNASLITDNQSADFLAFQEHLTDFTKALAQLVVRDGEGATKFVTVAVKGAKVFSEAKTIAMTIASSSLVKTALYGQDANWGRIICAVGYTGGVTVDPHTINLRLLPADGSTPLQLVEHGEPLSVDEVRALDVLQMSDIHIEVDLAVGDAAAEVYTCDLSHEYITINADYRS